MTDYDLSEMDGERLIRNLPRWAKVAFAARCARRVLPVIRSEPPGDVDPARMAAEISERAAETASAQEIPGVLSRLDEWIHRVEERLHEFEAAAAPNGNADAEDEAQARADACHAEFYALRAVAHAVRAAADPDATEAAIGAYQELHQLAADDRQAFELQAAVDRDVTTIAAETYEGVGEDDPVPLSTFGALWPDGTPHLWPTTSEQVADGLTVELVVQEGHDSEAVAGAMAKLYSALNALHMAYGGSGLVMPEGGGDTTYVEDQQSARQVG